MVHLLLGLSSGLGSVIGYFEPPHTCHVDTLLAAAPGGGERCMRRTCVATLEWLGLVLVLALGLG